MRVIVITHRLITASSAAYHGGRGALVGDIRSRLIRLIPPAPPGTPLDAVRTLLAHRLPSSGDAEHAAREEWRSIVEGRSNLWAGIPEDRKETIRGAECGGTVPSPFSDVS
jgi:hypothetical protein